MTHQSLYFLAPGIGPAGLPLPLPFTAQALPDVDHTTTPPDAAEIEYASWLPSPDAGALAFDAQAAAPRRAVR
jgi:hypothetical protein